MLSSLSLSLSSSRWCQQPDFQVKRSSFRSKRTEEAQDDQDVQVPTGAV